MLTTDDFNFLVGKTLEQAQTEIPKRYSIFVNEKDGEALYRPQEMDPHRINVRTKKGTITKVDGVN